MKRYIINFVEKCYILKDVKIKMHVNVSYVLRESAGIQPVFGNDFPMQNNVTFCVFDRKFRGYESFPNWKRTDMWSFSVHVARIEHGRAMLWIYRFQMKIRFENLVTENSFGSYKSTKMDYIGLRKPKCYQVRILKCMFTAYNEDLKGV